MISGVERRYTWLSKFLQTAGAHLCQAGIWDVNPGGFRVDVELGLLLIGTIGTTGN
jgi:hypothetical protein